MGLRDALRGLLTRPSTTPAPAPTPPPNPSADARGYAVVDVETSGLSYKHHRIVEIAVVLTDPWGHVQHEWHTRVNPEGPVGATHIHGITEADVIGAPRFAELVPYITSLLRGRALVAHNASFDLSFLQHEFGRANWAWPTTAHLCTLEHSHYFLPALDRRRLPDCCWACGIPLRDAHSALGDARATAALVRAFMDPRVGRPPTSVHGKIIVDAAQVLWPSAAGQVPPGASIPTVPPVRVARSWPLRTFTPSPAIESLLDGLSLVDAIDEGAPPKSLSYLEVLAEALEDGILSDEERLDLQDVAEAAGLSAREIHAAHVGLTRALARAALEDGKVTRAERDELNTMCAALELPDGTVADLLSGAEEERLLRLSTGLRPLPSDWMHGEPLVVGDRVVFTGCDEQLRATLEKKSEKRGVRVMSSVTRRTKLLVTDGGFHGTKAAAAEALNIRTVHPDTFAVLLAHRQPFVSTSKPMTAPRRAEGAAHPGGLTHRAHESAPAYTPADVRAWARERGIAVSARGRLPHDVVRAYEDDRGVAG